MFIHKTISEGIRYFQDISKRNDNQTQIIRHKYSTMSNFDISILKEGVIL